MKKKDYQKPAMQVVELQQRIMLMQASANSVLDVTYTEEVWNEE